MQICLAVYASKARPPLNGLALQAIMLTSAPALALTAPYRVSPQSCTCCCHEPGTASDNEDSRDTYHVWLTDVVAGRKPWCLHWMP